MGLHLIRLNTTTKPTENVELHRGFGVRWMSFGVPDHPQKAGPCGPALWHLANLGQICDLSAESLQLLICIRQLAHLRALDRSGHARRAAGQGGFIYGSPEANLLHRKIQATSFNLKVSKRRIPNQTKDPKRKFPSERS